MRFEALRETLLRGGIAPRHVRRYLRELEEHYADLHAAQREAGLNEADAATVARTQLGEEKTLAQAMIEQRDFRAFSARFPWAIFLLAPPSALVLVYALWVGIVLLISDAGGVLRLPAPEWFQWTATILTFAANLVIGPMSAWALAWIAQRQRLSLVWPCVAIAVIFAFGFQGATEFGGTGWTIRLHTAFPLGLGPSGPGALHWPTFLVQAVLLSLPLFWLLRRQRRIGAPA